MLAAELKAGGFTVEQLREAGFSTAQLKVANFSVLALMQAGVLPAYWVFCLALTQCATCSHCFLFFVSSDPRILFIIVYSPTSSLRFTYSCRGSGG